MLIDIEMCSVYKVFQFKVRKAMRVIISVLLSILTLTSFAKGLDPNVIRKVLGGGIPMMKKCYQDELKRNGKIFSFSPILHFKINTSGDVQSSNIEVLKADPENKSVKITSTCVNDVLKSIKFPKPVGGGFVEVNQPLSFTPKLKSEI
jgi:hypothetical protein